MKKIKINESFIYNVIIIVSLFISLYSFFYFISNKIYFIGSDAYYYWSLSDSFLRSGVLLNITVIPNELIRTPQIGMVFVHIILSLININGESRFLFISIFYYLLHLSALYPLNQIIQKLGIKNYLSRLFIISAHLGAWNIYLAQLLANNDGFFNPLSIWFIYLMIVIAQIFHNKICHH